MGSKRGYDAISPKIYREIRNYNIGAREMYGHV